MATAPPRRDGPDGRDAGVGPGTGIEVGVELLDGRGRFPGHWEGGRHGGRGVGQRARHRMVSLDGPAGRRGQMSLCSG